jgi:hypothetical protein
MALGLLVAPIPTVVVFILASIRSLTWPTLVEQVVSTDDL